MIWLFIALAILFVCATLFFLLFPFIKKRKIRKDYVRIYGKKIYSLADEDDYYLINQLILQSNDDSKIYIDHLLFGNKFIFVIKDYYFEGAIEAKESDPSWVYFYGDVKSPDKRYIDNPLLENARRLKKLSQITGLDDSLLISIVLINDDCLLTSFESTNNANYLVKRKDLRHLIHNIEKRDVAPLDDEQLRYAVHDLARLNLKP